MNSEEDDQNNEDKNGGVDSNSLKEGFTIDKLEEAEKPID